MQFTKAIGLFTLAAVSTAAPAAQNAAAPVCSAQSQMAKEGKSASLECPLLNGITSAVSILGANLSSGVLNLASLGKALTAATPEEVQSILGPITSGTLAPVLTSLTLSVITTNSVAGLIFQIDPQCKCDGALCFTALKEAQSETAAQPQGPNTLGACTDARYSCGPFFTSQQLEEMIPNCPPAGETAS